MKNVLSICALALALTGCAPQESSSTAADAAKPNASPASGAETPASAATGKEPAATEPSGAPAAAAPVEAATPPFREVTIPEGTTLSLRLGTAVGSDTSNVEDPVHATLRRPVTIEGVEALPAGTAFSGHVTQAVRSARVKGRAQIAFRFTRADPPGDGGRLNVRTATVSRMAEATKKQDAAKIGGGAVGGAIVGGIIGGGDGAAKGAVIGGGAGTAAVLATRGKEVRLPAGTAVSVKLTAPVTVRIPMK